MRKGKSRVLKSDEKKWLIQGWVKKSPKLAKVEIKPGGNVIITRKDKKVEKIRGLDNAMDHITRLY